jgi:hypothetical protein
MEIAGGDGNGLVGIGQILNGAGAGHFFDGDLESGTDTSLQAILVGRGSGSGTAPVDDHAHGRLPGGDASPSL